jgi:hypothetical protein
VCGERFVVVDGTQRKLVLDVCTVRWTTLRGRGQLGAISSDVKWYIREQMVLPTERVGVIERNVFFWLGLRTGMTNLFFLNEFGRLPKAYYWDELYAGKAHVFESFLFCGRGEAW